MAKQYQKYLPVGIAVVAGAALLFYMRKAKAEPTPIGPTPTPPPPEPGPPVEPKKPSGSKKKDAPAFPYTLSEANAVEAAQTTAEHAEWMALMSDVLSEQGKSEPDAEAYAAARSRAGIPSGRTIPGFLTDEAFDVLYGSGITIPSSSNRGQGWQPFVDSWMRMRELLKKKNWVAG